MKILAGDIGGGYVEHIPVRMITPPGVGLIGDAAVAARALQ